MEPIKVDFTGGSGAGKGKGSGKDAYLSPSKAGLKTVISIIGTVIGAAIAYYFMLPPLNFKSTELYLFLGVVVLIYLAFQVVLSGVIKKPEYTQYVKKQAIVPFVIIGVLVAVVAVGFVVSSVVFRASSYSKIIDVDENKTFSINKESQFEVAQKFTQINYKNSPVRVGTLAYGDVFKWLKNTKEGMPGYIIVDMVTQKTEFVMLKEGEYIRYSTEEHFSKYLMRHVRFAYPTYIFDEPHFEIDESGRPFWLCPVLDKTIGLFGGTDVKGVVIVDAITGECNEYSLDTIKNDKSFQWIDGIYSDNLLVEQYNYYGKYAGGFINSIIGQEGVRVATEGSNFLALNDDVYMYTGVTSVSNDQAIIGFVLVNMRTKEANFYTISGAKEYSAMDSAEGQVQNYKWTATFPILLNISGQPTYFMSLKDDANLVKCYAMVNVQNYQVVAIGDKISECTENYVKLLAQRNINIKVDIDKIKDDTDNISNTDSNKPAEDETASVKGVVEEIRTAVMGGESYYFIKLEGKKPYFKVAASQHEAVVILNVGDSAAFTYKKDASGSVIEADMK